MSLVTAQIIGDQKVIDAFRLAPQKAVVAARTTLDAWATELAGYIKINKLSGSPLHRRSGRLSSSVHPVTGIGTETTVSAGAGGGAGVPYAKIHEFGGTISHPGGTAYFVSQLLGGKAFFVANDSPSAAWLPRTKPHAIPMPERSYMRSAFREQAPEGMAALRKAVMEAIRP